VADKSSRGTTLAAHEGLGSITMCSCGVVSLHMGGVSLRMEISAFSRLEALVREAAEELCTRALLLDKMKQRGPSLLTH
jgi:hypothetical protein